MLAVIEGHPDRKFVMLFMRDNRIQRRSKTYYSDWCMERDIDYDVGQLKQEWLTYEKKT